MLSAHYGNDEKRTRHHKIQQESKSCHPTCVQQASQRVDNQRRQRYRSIICHKHYRQAHRILRRIGHGLRRLVIDHRLIYTVAGTHKCRPHYHGPFGVNEEKECKSGGNHCRRGHHRHAAKHFQYLRKHESRQEDKQEINGGDRTGNFRRPMFLFYQKARACEALLCCHASRWALTPPAPWHSRPPECPGAWATMQAV